MKIWLRHETKAHEQRVTITPETAKALLESSSVEALHVERSPTRIFPDAEYEKAGCIMEDTNAWMTLAPDDNTLIVGLKELMASDAPVVHKHTYFAHVFKNQEGWREVLQRYIAGKGVIYDYEFLNNPDGNNVGAGMSPFAGFVGCAVGLQAWCAQHLFPDAPLAPVVVSTKAKLCEALREQIDEIQNIKGIAPPTVLVMGALGRCGSGAVECAERLGLTVLKWDKEETAKGGPFSEILTDADVFVNCILLQGNMPPFITRDLLKSVSDRRLRVISDVSCDPNSDNNPLPIYDAITSWETPATRVLDGPAPLDLVSIDNLPSVLAEEASHAFAALLLPALLQYPDAQGWKDAEKVFREKLALAANE